MFDYTQGKTAETAEDLTAKSNYPQILLGKEATSASIPLLPICDDQTSAREPIPGQERCTTVPENIMHQKPTRKLAWVGSWTWEIAGAGLSLICLVLLVVFLKYADGAEYDTWQYRLSPNTVASAIVTVAKASLLLMVSSSLSQLKWNPSNEKTRLYHFQVLDQASRGPWGSLEVLWRWKLKPGLITAGAFLTVFSVAIDPLAQQLLSYPIIRRKTPSSDGLAYAQSTHSYSAQDLTGLTPIFAQYEMEPDMVEAIVSGLGGKSTGLEPVCPTGDCEYPVFVSLGICSSCEDVTAKSTQICDMTTIEAVEHDDLNFFNKSLPLNCSYTTPNNNTIEPRLFTGQLSESRQGAVLYRQPWTSIVTSSSLLKSRIVSFLSAKYEQPVLFYTTQNTTTWEQRPVLTECSLSWCEKQYSNNYYSSNGHRTLVATRSQVLSDPTLPLDGYFWIFSSPNGSILSSQASNYTVDSLTGQVTSNKLEYLFNSILETVGQSTSPINTALILYNSKNLTETIAQMASSMTDAIRSKPGAKNSNVDGDAYKSSTIVHVRWGWIALPIAYVIMAILILLATAMSSRKSIIWKASMLPFLLGHIQTRPEHDLTGLPLDVDQIVDMTRSIEIVTARDHPLLLVEE
ncbi:hypothetical protein N7449_005422 [Penicillium cf. viridicatum]|uniref:Uncharacterized protein n=1 Tax=Penicillium cf. viridicatum TaxID=2972119 RepID=A0A9W9SYZ6_9EURO|nr:hypothetical protein N7449_005422 [Penicillium cf. viridicatum]